MLDSNGQPIPGSYTEAEVQAKVAEAQATAKKESEAAIATATAQVAELKTKLDGMSDKDQNFTKLRTELEAATKRLGDLETATTGAHRSTVVKKLAGSDVELEKKIAHHYEKTLAAMPATTPEEINARAEAAFKLAVDVTQPDPFKSIRSSAPQGSAPGGSPAELSPELKQAAPLFGLSEDDLKKFGPKK